MRLIGLSLGLIGWTVDYMTLFLLLLLLLLLLMLLFLKFLCYFQKIGRKSGVYILNTFCITVFSHLSISVAYSKCHRSYMVDVISPFVHNKNNGSKYYFYGPFMTFQCRFISQMSVSWKRPTFPWANVQNENSLLESPRVKKE